MNSKIYLIRHGETAWSLTGQHTGWTDIPLNENGEREALTLAPRLKGVSFDHVFCSPLQRAKKTCELAGLADQAVIWPDVREWNYGDYGGKTLEDIHAQRPNWNLFIDGCPGGESSSDMSARADRVVAKLKTLHGTIAIFAHGHFLRVLASRWVGFPVTAAGKLCLSTASISVLSVEHHDAGEPVIYSWNQDKV